MLGKRWRELVNQRVCGVAQEPGVRCLMERCSESPVTHPREEAEHKPAIEVMPDSLVIKVEKESERGSQSS